jgi:PAS domain S-box-containing protein
MPGGRRHRLEGWILDELPFAVIATDADGTVTYWNARATDLYGWSAKEAVGRPIGTLTVQPADTGQADEIMAALGRGETWEGTFPVQHRDGTKSLAHVRDIPLYDDDGKVVGVLGLSEAIDPDVGAEVRVERLAAVSNALAAALTPEAVADAVLVEGAAVLGAQSAVLCRLRTDGARRLDVVAAKGYPAPALAVIESAPIDDLGIPLAVAVRTGNAVLLEQDDAGGAVAALPLLAGGEVVGGIGLGFDRPRPFRATDRRLLTGLASASAQALHRSELYADAEERLQILNAFMDAAPVGLAIIDDDLRFVVANRYLGRLVGADDGELRGRRADESFAGCEPDLTPSLRVVLDEDVPVIGIEIRGLGSADTISLVSGYPVPGPRGMRRIGVVVNDITATRRDEARLREESQIVETLHFVGRQLAGELETDRVLEVVTKASTLVTEAETGVFLAADPDAPVMLASAGDAAPFMAAFELALVEPTLRRAEVVRLDDLGGRGGVTSLLAVPVVARDGRTHGALVLASDREAVFDERDVRLVVGIAAQAAVALDDARLYQDEREARQRLALLAEAGRVLSSSLDVDELVARVAELVVPELAEVCIIDLREDDGTVRRVATTGRDAQLAAAFERHGPQPDDLANNTLRQIRTATSVQFVTVDEEFVAAAWPDDPDYQRLLLDNVAFAVVVPMMAREGIIGRLSLVVGPGGRQLDNDDAPLLLDLARRIAVAVENARLFSRQRSVAVSLQQSLLPDRLPVVPGVTMAARYLPGGPDVDVGGDWYDVLPMPDGTMGFAMGDVVGRGVRAASLMGQLRSALRAYALEGHAPGACLERLDTLIDVITGGTLVTAVKGHLYPKARRAVIANAGHPPPLLLHPDGSGEFVAESLGVPLSTLDVPEYEDLVLQLTPGCTLVLYTDGLVEVRDESLDVGLARLVDAFRSGPSDDLEALCDHVISFMLGDGETRDDVALLVVRLAA